MRICIEAKFIFAVLRIAKVDFRRFIFRYVSELSNYLLLIAYHTMENSSAYKATSEPIISDDSFYIIFCRNQGLYMTVTMSAI